LTGPPYQCMGGGQGT